MFELGLSEEQELIRRTAAEFGAERLGPTARAHEAAGRVSDSIAAAHEDLGLARVDLPQAAGGTGLGPLEKALVVEGLAAGDAAALLALEGIGPAAYPVLEMGGESERALLAELSRGRGWVVLDDDAERLMVEDGRIRGTWPWAPIPDDPALLVVLRRDRAYLLRTGVTASPVKPCALHAAGSSELAVEAPVSVVLEERRGMARTRAWLRLLASAMLVGVASASLSYASDYAQERVAFGRPLAHHQGLAFLVAELATMLDAARLGVWRAAWALEQDGDPTEAAAGALLDAAAAALACGEQGVQLLGGHGYVTDHPVEKWMREARTIAQLWGGRDAALDDLAARALTASAKPAFVVPAWEE